MKALLRARIIARDSYVSQAPRTEPGTLQVVGEYLLNECMSGGRCNLLFNSNVSVTFKRAISVNELQVQDSECLGLDGHIHAIGITGSIYRGGALYPMRAPSHQKEPVA